MVRCGEAAADWDLVTIKLTTMRGHSVMAPPVQFSLTSMVSWFSTTGGVRKLHENTELRNYHTQEK